MQLYTLEFWRLASLRTLRSLVWYKIEGELAPKDAGLQFRKKPRKINDSGNDEDLMKIASV